jgi:hypothetical protein
VGINFGGLDVGMAHQFLDLAYLIHEFEAGVRLEFGFIFHVLALISNSMENKSMENYGRFFPYILPFNVDMWKI